MNKSLLDTLNACPPFICYYAAQIGRNRRPTLDELVKISGMSQRTFGRIAHRTTWDGVPIDKASRFLTACGINVFEPESVMVWVAERKASGKLDADFDLCRGQGKKMLENFNLLCSKLVMSNESPMRALGSL